MSGIPVVAPSQKSYLSEQSVSGDRDVIDFGYYWRTIMGAKWLIIVVTICFMVAGVIISKQAIPIYGASAKILADPQKPSAIREQQGISGALVVLFYKTQYEIISSRNIAESVVDKLGLVEKFKERERNANTEETSISFIDSILDSTNLSKLLGKADDENIPQVPLSDRQLREKIASEIQKTLEVSGGQQSQIIEIRYTSPYAQEAADIVNAIAESYIQFGLDSRLSEVKNTENWLSDQSSQLKTALQESEIRLSQYRLQEGLVDTEQQQNFIRSQLQSLNNELIAAQTRLSTFQEQYFAVRNVDADSKELYSLGPVLQNLSTRDMVVEQARLSQRLNELFERYGEKHPKMIAARSELKSANENLANEVSKVVENIETDYRLAQVQVSNIQNLITKTKETVQSSQTENFSLVSLERDVDNNRRIYENFQVNLLEATGISDYSASNVQIIDSALTPETPFKPNKKLIFVMATMFGFGVSILITFVRAALNNNFNTPEDIEDKLFVPSIGITPLVKLCKTMALPEHQYLQDSLTPFSESINTIRTGLLFSNIGAPPKTFLVTSANSGEGKSTLAINLAVAFSNLGKTLLLDTDLRKPSVAKYLGLTPKYGLTDLLKGSLSVSDVVLHLKNPKNLEVMTSGTNIRNPLEFLSSDKFEDLLESLKTQYEFIILDGPPVLAVSDALIVANQVDSVIFAIKAQKTKLKMAKGAIARLEKVNAKVTGGVLTVADPQKMNTYGDQMYATEYYGEAKSGKEEQNTANI